MCSKAILGAEALGCASEMLTIVSALSVDSLFFAPSKLRQQADAAKRRFASVDGDHLTLLSVWSAYQKVFLPPACLRVGTPPLCRRCGDRTCTCRLE